MSGCLPKKLAVSVEANEVLKACPAAKEEFNVWAGLNAPKVFHAGV